MRNRPRCVTVIAGMALQALALVCGALPAGAAWAPAAGDPARPEYQIGSAGRFNEDW